MLRSCYIWGWSRGHQPRLESMGYGNKVFGKTIGLEFGKRAFRISSGIRRRGIGHCGGVDPSETGKQTAGRAWAGNTETPPPPNERKRQRNSIRVPLGTSARKKGAVVLVGAWTARKRPEQPRKVTSRAGTSERRERCYTVRLFGMNSFKEGAVWHVNSLLVKG
jgi:hypothetical protein